MKKGKLNVVNESEQLEKKKAKELKARERYMNSMVSRKEAADIAKLVSEETTRGAFGVITNPLSTAIIELMAVSQLLTEKGILEETEITERIQKIATSQLEAEKTGDATDGEEGKEEN